uniref:Synaptobrevin homolog n=1 Tax=Hirudo medicinalis TaxID=6421 RepID=O01388_HIRME|nr:synaptobrevin homolog [Hirudo medicinalis]
MAQPPPKPSTGPGGLPAPGAPPQPAPQSKRLQQAQAQVDEVVDMMRVNVDKVLEKDQKLAELDGRADALQAGASQFEASAGKLKRKFWWKNMKMMLIMGAVVAVVVVIFGAWIYNKFSGTSSVPQEGTPVLQSPMAQQPQSLPENIPPASPVGGGGGGKKGKNKQPHSS